MLTFFIRRPRFAMVIALLLTFVGAGVAEADPGGAVPGDHPRW